MSNSSDSIFGITTSVVTIAPGATNAVLVFPGNWVRATLFKYNSGGSVSIFGNPQTVPFPSGGTAVGTTYGTLSGANLVAGYSSAYLLGTNEVISLGGPAMFYLAATGSTALVYLMQGVNMAIPSFTSPG